MVRTMLLSAAGRLLTPQITEKETAINSWHIKQCNIGVFVWMCVNQWVHQFPEREREGERERVRGCSNKSILHINPLSPSPPLSLPPPPPLSLSLSPPLSLSLCALINSKNQEKGGERQRVIVWYPNLDISLSLPITTNTHATNR